MANISEELFWRCDDCGSNFTIGNGFLGSVNDLDGYFDKTKKANQIEECNPFMSFIQICDVCVETRKAKCQRKKDL